MRTLGRVNLIVLIGLFAFGTPSMAQSTRPEPPGGPVRIQGRAVADARGPFNALGATLFWGAWGYKHDRPRLERNLAVLEDAGVDYVRVLGTVGGETWEDRESDPRWSDYDAIIAGLTDLAYDRYGLRVQWTLFGGAPFTPPGRSRAAIVDEFAAMAKGREHKLFAFEIANESWQNGFEGATGVAELRALGKRLNDKTDVLVALSAPAVGAACATYAGALADVITMHYERGFGEEGPELALRRPWTFPAAYDRKCRGQLPTAVFNNEPIGPESSVRQDDDPGRIAAGFIMSFLAGNASYVLHTGPGIRGGGTRSKLDRHDHFDELPSFDPIVGAIGAAKRYLPAGLANWTRHEPNAADAPVRGFEHAYAASSGSRFIVLVLGSSKTVTLRVREAAAIDVRGIATGQVLERLDVAAGGAIRVSGREPMVLIGRTKSP